MLNQEVYDKVVAAFAAKFGGAPVAVSYAPGRIEVLGNHTDYNEGYVFSAAIDKGTFFAVSPSSDDKVTLVALDIGDHGDIHPKNKRAVGERLAALALAQTYGRTDQALSPVPMDEAGLHADALDVAFVDPLTGKPTVNLAGNDVVRGFEVAGADGRFVRVAARTCDFHNIVRVSIPQGMEPARVRYAWDDYPDCNLVTEAGLPVGPFELPVDSER